MYLPSGQSQNRGTVESRGREKGGGCPLPNEREGGMEGAGQEGGREGGRWRERWRAAEFYLFGGREEKGGCPVDGREGWNGSVGGREIAGTVAGAQSSSYVSIWVACDARREGVAGTVAGAQSSIHVSIWVTCDARREGVALTVAGA